MVSNPCGALVDAARADKAADVENCNRLAGAAIGCESPDIFMQGKTFHAACADAQCRAVLDQAAE